MQSFVQTAVPFDQVILKVMAPAFDNIIVLEPLLVLRGQDPPVHSEDLTCDNDRNRETFNE